MSKRLVVTLGDKVRSRREGLGMSQYELAQKSGLRPEVVSRIETGKSGASLASLHKLAPILGLSIDELVRDQSTVRKTTGAETAAKTTKGKK